MTSIKPQEQYIPKFTGADKIANHLSSVIIGIVLTINAVSNAINSVLPNSAAKKAAAQKSAHPEKDIIDYAREKNFNKVEQLIESGVSPFYKRADGTSLLDVVVEVGIEKNYTDANKNTIGRNHGKKISAEYETLPEDTSLLNNRLMRAIESGVYRRIANGGEIENHKEDVSSEREFAFISSVNREITRALEENLDVSHTMYRNPSFGQGTAPIQKNAAGESNPPIGEINQNSSLEEILHHLATGCGTSIKPNGTEVSPGEPLSPSATHTASLRATQPIQNVR